MGRPSKLTPQVSKRICEAIRQGATPAVAAAAVGVNASTLRRWLADERPQFRALATAMREAQAEVSMELLRRLQVAADKMTWRAAAWMLDRSERRARR